MANPVVFEIPTKPQAQKFSIQLAGTFYRLGFAWCAPNNAWTLDILNQNDVPIIAGIPLVTGANLLEQYAYLGIGGQLIVQSDDSVDKVPTYANLGSIGHIYFLPDV